MKRTFKYALSAVLGLGMVASAFAQQSYVDVQDSHWAADAVNRLKVTGLLQGYQDGTFKGGNSITRYEMASMIYGVYMKLVGNNEEIEAKVKALETRINNVKPQTKPAPVVQDFSDIKKMISDLNLQVGGFKAWGNDLKMLKTMGEKYQTELKSLGVDMAGFKKSISSLSDRVSALEKRTEGVRITGDANFFVSAASASNGSPVVINQDGRYISTTGNGAGLDSLLVNHEIGIQIASAVDAAIPVKGELVLGNLYSNGINGWGTQSDVIGQLGQPVNDAGFAGYVNRLEAYVPTWKATFGRQGLNLGKYVTQRMDTNSFYTNSREDNGEWAMDGVRAGVGTKLDLELFLGRIASMPTTAGGNIQPLDLGFGNIDQVMGVTGKLFGGNISYVSFDNNPGVPGPNRVQLWGIDGLKLSAFGVNFEAGYGESKFLDGNSTIPGGADNNKRWNVDANFKLLGVNIDGGYRRVEAGYTAPGNWGRTSILRNLTDVTSWNAGTKIGLGGKAHLFGRYESGQGLEFAGEFTNLTAGLMIPLTSKWDAVVSYEDTDFKNGFYGFADGSKSKFTTLGLTYNTGNSSMFKLFYQHSDLNPAFTAGAGGLPGAGGTLSGGFLGAQYTVKF